jgi:hypothetical protein
METANKRETTMSKQFKITANGTEMGIYEGGDANTAILAYVKDAGYETVKEAAEVCGQTEDAFCGDIICEEI